MYREYTDIIELDTATFTVYEFTDPETGSIINYIPTINMSGYGDNSNEALEMLKLTLSLNLKNEDLDSNGWELNQMNHIKYVDESFIKEDNIKNAKIFKLKIEY